MPANSKLAYMAEAVYLGNEPFSSRADLRVSKDSSQAGGEHPCSHWHSQHKRDTYVAHLLHWGQGDRTQTWHTQKCEPKHAQLPTCASHLPFAGPLCPPSQLSFRVLAHTTEKLNLFVPNYYLIFPVLWY